MNESPKRGLLAAYGRLLAPLIRILIRNGVSYSEFAEAAKQIYVDVAATSFLVGSKQQTLERTAVLAGVSTEEVQDVWDLRSRYKVDGLDSNLNRNAVLLSAWHTDSDFTGPYGVPLELQIDGDGDLDFNELVRRHIGDTDPRPLLKELVAAGAVRETEKGWFRVVTRFYMPQGVAPAGMDHLSRSVEDFVSTLDHNAIETESSKKMFERQTYTADGIRREDLPRFTEYATSRAKILLEDIDNWVSQLDLPNEPDDEQIVTGLGIYQYIHKKTIED